MTGQAISAAGARLARSPRTAPLVVALAAVAGVLASLAVMSLVRPTHESTATARTYSAPGEAFAVALPDGWSTVHSDPRVSVLRRDDGRGMVVVRPTAPLRTTGPALAATLGRQLRKRFPGLRPVSARLVRVRGGQAFAYTFVHGSGPSVQSLVLASAHGRAFAIDSIVPAGAPDAARQVGAIVASFGP